jgi:hypothetical protein
MRRSPRFWRGAVHSNQGIAAPIEYGAARLSILHAPDYRRIWESLVQRSPQASIYHSLQWQRILKLAYGIQLQAAIVEDDSGPMAGCLLARPRTPFSRRLIGLPFSDYCAPLSCRPGATELLLQQLARELGRQGCYCELRGTIAPPPWKIVDTFVNWTVDLQEPAPAVLGRVRGNFRRAARRAEQDGVVLSRGSGRDYVRRFYLQHLENRRRFGLPAQPWRFFRLIADIMGPNGDLEVWIASVGGRDVGSVVLLKDGPTLYCKWTARVAQTPTGTMQLLFWKICESYAGRFETFDLGRTDARNDGLASFKRYLGAGPVPLPYAYYPDTKGHINAEHLSGPAALAATMWRHMPLSLARILGGAVYGYLT